MAVARRAGALHAFTAFWTGLAASRRSVAGCPCATQPLSHEVVISDSLGDRRRFGGARKRRCACDVSDDCAPSLDTVGELLKTVAIVGRERHTKHEPHFWVVFATYPAYLH